MCGSGTFVIEAAQIAADLAPGAGRRFAFESWPDFDAACWRALRQAAEARARRSLEFTIEGADRHGGALSLARKGAQRAGVGELVRFTNATAKGFVPAQTPAVVVVNPPYGLRLGEGEELLESWRELGQFLHQRCGGAVAWVLSGNREVTRHLGLRCSRRLPVWNGQIECRFLRYAID
jgi:putative N6-adenine-specific DNA methylase